MMLHCKSQYKLVILYQQSMEMIKQSKNLKKTNRKFLENVHFTLAPYSKIRQMYTAMYTAVKTGIDVHTTTNVWNMNEIIQNISGAFLTKKIWRIFPRTLKGFPVLLEPYS